MISGAESGSCAIGEPHSEQKIRWTALPELPMPAQLLVGPLISTLALGTTATSAVAVSAGDNDNEPERFYKMRQFGRRATYSKWNRFGVGSHRNGRSR
jgi:hypothetical protein